MIQNKALGLIGLATKAGKVTSGEFMTEKEVKARRARLVILAGDVSDNTREKFTNLCQHYQVPVRMYSDKASLGHAIGKELRASLAIMDEGFAKSILSHLEDTTIK